MDSMRNYWLEQMLRIAGPVIGNLAEDHLKAHIPTAFHEDRKDYIMLEAFARTLAGLAPWLELPGLDGEEEELQAEWREKVQRALANAVNPEAKDYMNFLQGDQPLVDCGFLAHAIIRAPEQLFRSRPPEVQKQLITALQQSRGIKPFPSNWLFFSGIVEAALCLMGAPFDKKPVLRAVHAFEDWYLGDGLYGDGPDFHFDYYNSFVIHPMYVDMLRVMASEDEECAALLPVVLARAQRYAAIQERLIAPDGSYPIIGRSICYRFGNFQLLSQAALQGFLPMELAPARVRAALTAVLHRVFMSEETMFDSEGWLRPGVFGEQPELAESYISVGSLYLCETFFLPLGLEPEHRFWNDPPEDWTSKKVWSGGHVMIDHALS